MIRSFFPLLAVCAITAAIIIAGCANAGQPRMSPLVPASGTMTTITAGDKEYPAYLAVPATSGKHPGLVLVHSFNGLEPGYKEMCDRIAADGFVVIAPAWQTLNQRAGDAEVGEVIRASRAALESRPDVDSSRLGLTGFCAGGRYTMLFLPQMKEFRAGVAWYGFPDSQGYTNDTTPTSHINELSAPLLMIHGSRDQASPIGTIYNYSTRLDAVGKYFELKVYQGQPHGFMIVNGSLVKEDYANDAYNEMITFFTRKL